MAEYYLISQLPTLDGLGENSPLPITEERFLELCNCHLKEKTYKQIEKLTLIPSREPQKTGNALVEAFDEGERNLRLALAKIRADKMNKSFDIKNDFISAELIKVANIATEMESPLEAENFLLNYRLSFLESLRPMDNFSEDFVFYYALKLKLIMRIRQFSTELGEIAYRNIYDSIINGDRLEAI